MNAEILINATLEQTQKANAVIKFEQVKQTNNVLISVNSKLKEI